MSRFSDYLRQLIEERGEPISQIAKKAGLERTSIHKALNNERILPYISVKKLERYFQLSLSQIRELNRYYDMLLQGEDRYRIWEESVKFWAILCSFIIFLQRNRISLTRRRE